MFFLEILQNFSEQLFYENSCSFHVISRRSIVIVGQALTKML